MDAERFNLTDIVDGVASGADVDTWLAANPDAAAEVALARRVRLLIARLNELEIEPPPGFEARLMERIRNDRTVVDLLDLLLSGLGRTLIELINMIFDLLSPPQSHAPAA